MNSDLKGELIHAIFGIKKIAAVLPGEFDINISEIMTLRKLSHCHSAAVQGLHVSELQKTLHCSKPAMSQMLNSLEKKGYVKREIDNADRRKIAVTPTESGIAVLELTINYIDGIVNNITERLGPDDTHELIRLLTRLNVIAEELRR